MVLWPSQNKLLFVNDRGNNHAEFDLSNETWSEVTTVNDAPIDMYGALSTWDSARELWVFRNGTDVAVYDPATRTHELRPSTHFAGKDIAYIPYWDVYITTGAHGAQTEVFAADLGTWTTVDGGPVVFLDTSFRYVKYNQAADRIMAYAADTGFYSFHYVPAEGFCP
jgi:hypothetical protein